MIKLFKEIRALTKATKWEVDSTKHDVVADNTRKMTIKEVLIKKCSFYYEFEEMMSDLSIITLSFIMKFTQFDIFENVTRTKEDSNNQFTNEDDWNSQNNVKKIHSENDVSVSVFELIKKKFDSMKRVKQARLQKRTFTFVSIKKALNVNFEDETSFKRFKRNLKKSNCCECLDWDAKYEIQRFFQAIWIWTDSIAETIWRWDETKKSAS